jgi:hypothetical protein
MELPHPFRVPLEVRWKLTPPWSVPAGESGNNIPKTISKSCSEGSTEFSSQASGSEVRRGRQQAGPKPETEDPETLG